MGLRQLDKGSDDLRPRVISGAWFRVSLLAVALVAVLVAVPSLSVAATVSPGVHVDPGSPVAKEYAIPLSQARGDGGSGGGPLFGRGITRAPSSAVRTPSAPVVGAGTKVVKRHRRAATHRQAAGRSRAPVLAGSAAQTSPHYAATRVPVSGSARGAGGGSGIVWMLGVAVLVLALGGLGSVAVGRYSRRPGVRTS